MTLLTDAEKFDATGKITWLWTQSELHRKWPVNAIANQVAPAVELGQFRLIERDGIPLAYCSWAWLSVEAEARYITHPARIRGEDWQSGERLWFIDWISPFSRAITWQLQRSMKKSFPGQVGRAYRAKPGRDKARVATFVGTGIGLDQATEQRLSLLSSLGEELRRLNKADRSFEIR